MAEKIQFTKPAEERLDEFGRAHSEKLQALGRALVSSLYMLVRSAKMYDSENAVFERPLQTLQDTLNTILSKESKVELMGVNQSFYLNGMLIRMDLSALSNVRFLFEELRSRDLGGFSLNRPVTVSELRSLLSLFGADHSERTPAMAEQLLVNLKLAKWSKLKEKLSEERVPEGSGIDRKKYALTVYGRAVLFLSKYLESVRAGAPISTRPALRLVQDFVDIAHEHRTHFLGMTTIRRESDYLVFHQVNVCLLTIVFGSELGLTKSQLRDLGYVALFHDAGVANLSDEISNKRGALTADERSQVQQTPLLSVRNILLEGTITRSTLLRVTATLEHKMDFGTPVRDENGAVQEILPKGHLGVFARILAICDAYDALTSRRPYRDPYGPQVALMLMWSEMRHRFDPELLKVFMRVMSIQPVKVLTKRQQTISLSGL